ncbi:MAG: metal-dependent hydrolase [Verrucomicrobiota bacterium]|jgi:hypothetical protein|nr:metal-dependent hydrolase [Verrucomicrobiota bacterium]
MKGFSHFMSGVAVASFGPWAIEAALQGNPIYFILGGACGILPDTLDFKFYRFFYEHDVYVTPDPAHLDPQYVADEIARAVAMAADEKRYIRLKLVSIRLGADFWQQYKVQFDNEKMTVTVKFGPVVNTGQVPVRGTENRYPAVGCAPLKAKVVQTYDAQLRVDIFDGPTVGLAPREDGGLELEFLPWHREWSHALTVGIFLGILWALISVFIGGWSMAWQGFVTIAACYGVHVVEDQLGHMGSNLFYPFSKNRTPGLHWMHSGDGLPNFLTVWISCILIFWNLYRGQPAMTYHFTFLHLIMVSLVVPGVIFWVLRKLLNRATTEEVMKGDDADDEWNEMKAAGS